MKPSHTFVPAVLATSANAFMIPSTMLDDVSLDNQATSDFGLNVAQLLDPETTSRLVKVECPGCAFPAPGENNVYSSDTENDLIFDFKTTEDRKALLLNDGPFFPLTVSSLSSGPLKIHAGQSAAGVSFDDLRSDFHRHVTEPRPLKFAFTSREMEAADGADAQLVDIDFQVLGLEDQPIVVDGLSIRLLQDEQGVISIVDIIQTPKNGGLSHEAAAEPSEDTEQAFKILPIGDLNSHSELDSTRPPRPHHGLGKHPRPSCEGMTAPFCRWAQMVEGKMHDAFRGSFNSHHAPKRPCPGMMRGHRKGPHDAAGNKIPIKGGIPKFMPWKYTPETFNKGTPVRPHRGHGPRPHGHHHHRGSFLHQVAMSAKHLFFGFIVPIMIGVAAGMTASLLGMFVGTLIAWTWIKLVRGGRRGYEAVEQVEADNDDAEVVYQEEKKTLVPADAQDEEEPLPVYTERHE